MTQVTLEFDSTASKSIKELMQHYGVTNKAALISKALAVLQTVTYVAKTDGELLARKGNHETRIVVS